MQHTYTKKSKKILELLAQTIREKRIELKKSQRLFAFEYGLEKSLISRLENGVNEPKVISVWSICEALGMKPSELFKLIEDKLPEDFSLIE